MWGCFFMVYIMASPQADNGYTRIANEIMDNLAKIRIAGEARQMLDVIIRKTYGFNKKEDKISTSQFMLLTGLSRIAIPKARRKLIELNLITVSQKGYSQGLTYSMQKDYEKWKPYPKKDTVSKKGRKCIQKSKQVYPKKDTNCIPKSSTQKKERQLTKDILQKTVDFPFLKDVGFTKAFNDYLDMRKNKATQNAIELRLKDLHKYDIKTAIAMIENSIMNGYQGIFPLNNKPNKQGVSYGQIKRHSEGYPEGTPFEE